MNKWVTGIVVIVVLLGVLYFMTRTSDITEDGTSVAIEESSGDVSTELETIETEEMEVENALSELEAKTF